MGENDILSFYQPPAWSTGHISLEDAAFLDEMVRELDPAEVIEIGVASGCSSAVLLRALDSLGGERRLHSFDIANCCYFAKERAVGAAVAELAPDYTRHWRLHTGGDATDAARLLTGRSIPLVFIDADHRHPYPTLDLLGVLPALSEYAWVILHDITLDRKWQVFGPRYLYAGWTGEKRTPYAGSNIGAIRLTGYHRKTRNECENILRVPWQTTVGSSLLSSLGVDPFLNIGADAFSCVLAQRIEKVGRAKRPVMIWGAGSTGLACLRALVTLKNPPVGFIDSDHSKVGSEIEGRPIHGPQILNQNGLRPYIVIASSYSREIEETLVRLDFAAGSDFGTFEVPGTHCLGNETDKKAGTKTPPGCSKKQLLGMTTNEEQDYLTQYAREQFKGQGAIVDLGCWLGSTTISLAAGLDRRPNAPKYTVNAFDTFRWESWMEPYAGKLAGKLHPGASFLGEFRKRIALYSEHISIHKGDLTRLPWDCGPIEFLLIDAMKNWKLSSSINKNFLPAVISAEGLVMHQDFKFWGCPWIHLTMYRLRKCFVLERDLEASPGTVFRLVSPITSNHVENELTALDFSVSEIESAYDYWLGCLQGSQVFLLDCARALALCGAGAQNRAIKLLHRIVEDGNRLPKPFLAEMAKHVSPADLQTLSNPWEEMLHCALTNQRSVWVWGAGSSGRSVLRQNAMLRKLAKGIVDRDPAKHGELVEGLLVAGIEWLTGATKPRPFVVVATQFANEVETLLSSWGYLPSKDFCIAQLY